MKLIVKQAMVRTLVLVMLVFAATTFAQQSSMEALSFASQEKKALYYQLTQEFRCLQCQNQNLAGSAAGLADDLKVLVYQMVQDGKTSAQIKSFMVERYGDFILYRPAFKPLTLLLWMLPFVLLGCGLYVVYRFSRRRSAISETGGATGTVNPSEAAALERARELLEHE